MTLREEARHLLKNVLELKTGKYEVSQSMSIMRRQGLSESIRQTLTKKFPVELGTLWYTVKGVDRKVASFLRRCSENGWDVRRGPGMW